MKKTLLFFASLFACIGLGAQAPVHFHVCTSFWPDGTPVSNTDLRAQITIPDAPPLTLSADDVSCATFTAGLTTGSEITYSGMKMDDQLNGLTVLDLVRMRSHILGISTIESPYAQLALDANVSYDFTTYDMVEFQKLMLGIYQQLPNNVAWRFFQENCDLSAPTGISCPGVSISDPLELEGDTLRLIGVKIGDVDGDANPQGQFAGATTVDSTFLDIPDIQLQAGVSTLVTVRLGGNLSLSGLQTEFLYNTTALHFDSIEVTQDFKAYSFGIFPGKITAVTTSLPEGLTPGETLMKFRFTASSTVQLSDVFSLHPSAVRSLGALGYVEPQGVKLGATFSVVSAVNTPASPLLLTQPSPNPFRDQTTFILQLEQQEAVRLEIFDAAGKRIYISENQVSSGVHPLTVPAEALAPGTVGYYRLQAGNRWASGKLVKL